MRFLEAWILCCSSSWVSDIIFVVTIEPLGGRRMFRPWLMPDVLTGLDYLSFHGAVVENGYLGFVKLFAWIRHDDHRVRVEFSLKNASAGRLPKSRRQFCVFCPSQYAPHRRRSDQTLYCVSSCANRRLPFKHDVLNSNLGLCEGVIIVF